MRTLLSTLIAAAAAGAAGAGEARLLRFPAAHGDKVAFTYGGDLYTAPSDGGVARRLTSHPGYEMFARFSPDGKHIAFTGQYDGNTEVYLIPAEGGVPVRLTYTATLGRDDVADRMGPNNIVVGWTPDGKHVLFRSRMRSFNPFLGKLFTVPVGGGLPTELPLPRGGFASYSPDGSKLAYNRVFREFRTWKRYRGGMADDVWVYDFKTQETRRVVEGDAQDIIPMWVGDKIYFASERGDGGRMNLYVSDLQTGDVRRVTKFTDFDVKFPSAGGTAIVFEQAGYIHKHDTKTGETKKLTIEINNDLPAARDRLEGVSDEVTNYEISPDGKSALFGARGDVFTVPAGPDGRTRNLTQTPGVHERNSKWSPDGKHVAYISDASGEDEIYVTAANGGGSPTKLTDGSGTYEYQLFWSPDSQKILWSDKKLRLRYVDVKSKKITEVAKAEAGEITQFDWSPDSKWVVYSRPEVDTYSKMYLYSLDDNKTHQVTEGFYSVSSPVFGRGGKYLFFSSDRTFNPTYSQTEWNHAYRDMGKIYVMALAADAPNPLRPGAEPAKKDDKKSKGVKIDLDGLAERTLVLPVKAGGYGGLSAVDGGLYYYRFTLGGGRPKFLRFDMKTRKETELGQVGGYEISADGKKMIVKQGSKYAIIPLPKSPVKVGKALNLSDMQVRLNLRAEWRQIFNECWRQMRAFFYAPNMHGVDWAAVRKKYEPLVDHVAHRKDLTYLIGEMISELNVGHAYIGGGQTPKVDRVPVGLLGAELERHETGYVKIARILKGARWDSSLRSPLRELGLNVQEGEFITAVDGRPVNEVKSIHELLLNKVNKPVTLTINKEPKGKGGRGVTVKPIGDAAALYYHAWVSENMRKVSEATGGRVGYVHIPDMGPNGLNQFAKMYYPQLGKKGMIIDVRGNGGGNVSPMIIERLRRKMSQVNKARNVAPSPNPSQTFLGPMVCLVDEFSASDGDIFTYRFKFHKLGPVVGKRSWGGVVGIRGSLPLLDGGDLRKPEFSRYDIDGQEWIIEGYGVDPDIVIDNDPAKEYRGVDQQLNRALAELKKLMADNPAELPKPPPYPKR